MKRKLTRISVFATGLLILGTMLNFFLQPVWTSWNNFSTFHGFYHVPDNTIETIFLGSSYTAAGLTPMELYEDYGICAYNLGSEQQPMLVSYYWLREAYRCHRKSLKTVVLQCAMLDRTANVEFYRKGIDAMHFSTVKYYAVQDYAKCTKNEKNTFFYYTPLFAYHDRWSSLTRDDFQKAKQPVAEYTMGFSFSLGRHLDSKGYADMAVPPYLLDLKAEPSKPNEEALSYLNKMIEFCDEKELKLVLITTPCSGTASEHHMLSKIADENNLEYMDFNYEPFSKEVVINRAVDSTDGSHLNYYGAEKLTSWFGKYLSEQCNATDVRENPRYEFMEEQLKQYHKEVLNVVTLKEQQKLEDYLSMAISDKDYAVFLIVKDEATKGLTDKTKELLSEMGLTKLSHLGFQESYLALFENGNIVFEATNGKSETKREGKLQNGRPYNLFSGGFNAGNKASCIIDGTEYSGNGRGINIIIYHEKTRAIIDATSFDTYLSTEREAGYLQTLLESELAQKSFPDLSARLQKLYLYNYRCEQTEKAIRLTRELSQEPEIDFIACLDEFRSDSSVLIFINVKDDASGLITPHIRKHLDRIGLTELARLKSGEAYVGVLHDRNVCLEKKGKDSVYAEYFGDKLCGNGKDSEGDSYIMTNNSRKDIGKPGINVVIYDTELRMVIYTANYTSEKEEDQP